MDQYLLQILKETNTIIIPGLGALTITNATTGEVMFMPFLKHDDGKLSAHIAEKEGIEENEAKNIVAKHVREIQTSVDKGESYDMFQFGTFVKGADGDIEFQNWDGDKKDEAPAEAVVPVIEVPATETPKAKEPEVETPKVEDTPVTPNVTKEEEKKDTPKPKIASKKEEPKVEEKAPVQPKEEKKAKAAPTEKPVVKEEPKVVTPPPVKKEEPVKEKKVAPVVPVTPPAPKKEMNIAEKEELSKSVEKLDKLKKEKEEGKKKKKRGVGFYMLILLILLLVGGGTYFAIDYDNLKQHIPFLADAQEKEEDPKALEELKETLGDEEFEQVDDSEEQSDDNMEFTEVAGEEELESETDLIEEEVSEAEPEPVAVSNGSNNQPFHIVAGAFSSPENAARLVEKIKAMGYPAKTFARGAQHIVSVKSYTTKAEAQAAIPSVKDAAPSGWVLEWNK